MILRYTVSGKDAGRKVYSVMRRELSLSEGMTRRLKQAKAIFVDGDPVYTDHLLKEGETLTADVTAAEPECGCLPERGSLEILYEDNGLIAVAKPQGMIVHPSHAKNTGTLANYVAGYLLDTAGDARCHAVNRLDRDTSGVVLFAKNSYMKSRASEALSGPDACKTYLALVEGTVEEKAGTVDIPIKRLREGDMIRVVSPDGQRAITHYETLASGPMEGACVSLLRIRLETGRTHQIRVHCLHLGHPVLGDGLYRTEQSSAVSEKLGIGRQALHAASLSFIEPLSGKNLTLKSRPPEVFSRAAALLGY